MIGGGDGVYQECCKYISVSVYMYVVYSIQYRCVCSVGVSWSIDIHHIYVSIRMLMLFITYIYLTYISITSLISALSHRRQHGMVFPTHDKCMDSARVIILREEGLLLRNRTLMVDENNKLSPSNKGFIDSRDDYDLQPTITTSAITTGAAHTNSGVSSGTGTGGGSGRVSVKTENVANVANPLTPPSSSSSPSTLHKNTHTNTHHVSTTHTDIQHTKNKQHTKSIHYANHTHHTDDSTIQYTDSMTKCLTCMEQYTTTLRHIYDREMTFRLQKQNQIIINHTSYYNDYIILLLTCLSESYVAERSSFNLNFIKIFEDIIVTTILSAHHSRFLSAYKSTTTTTNSNTATNSTSTTPIKAQTNSVVESDSTDIVSITKASTNPSSPPPPSSSPSPTPAPVRVLKRRSSWKKVDHVIPIPRVPSDLALNEFSNTTTATATTTSSTTISAATSDRVISNKPVAAAAAVVTTGNPDLSLPKHAPPSFLQSSLSTLFSSPASWLSPLSAAVAPTTTTTAPPTAFATVNSTNKATSAPIPPLNVSNTSSTTTDATTNNTNATTTKLPSRRSSKTSVVIPPLPNRDLMKPKNIILYTCSILVSKLSIPAQFYLTSQYIFIMSGIHIPGIPLGLSCHRECYSLYDIVNITHNNNNTNNNSINIVLYEYDKCILYITSSSTNLMLEWLTRVRRRLDTD